MLRSALPVLDSIWKKLAQVPPRAFIAGIFTLFIHLLAITFAANQILRTRATMLKESSSPYVMSVFLKSNDQQERGRPEEPTDRVISPKSPASSISFASAPTDDIMRDLPPPVVEILTPPDPHYFQVGELTEKPRVVQDIPSNLAVTLKNETPLSATFRLQINEQGEIDRVIVDSSQFSESEQTLLVDAFSKLKMEAGKIAGMPVKSELKIEIFTERAPPTNAR